MAMAKSGISASQIEKILTLQTNPMLALICKDLGMLFHQHDIILLLPASDWHESPIYLRYTVHLS